RPCCTPLVVRRTSTVSARASGISITAPADGATVSGRVRVRVTASDNVGVVGVQFQLDGAALGTKMQIPPFPDSGTHGIRLTAFHTLTAVARDAAGNQTTSTPVTVIVSNSTTVDTTPPTGTIIAPSDNAILSGAIDITVAASDNVGVAGVQVEP